MMKKRLLSMLSAIALVLSLFTLLPEGALRAEAYFGSGTENYPYVVTTYEDLERFIHTAKYNDWTGVIYIRLGEDIISKYDDKNSYNFALTGDCAVILDLAGHTLERITTTMDKAMFTVSSGASLTIKDSVGTGYVHSGLMHNINNPDCIRVYEGGTLTIEAGSFYNSNGTVINQVNGTVNILGGSFSNIYSHTLNSSAGNLLIDGGEFTCTQNYTPIYLFTQNYEIKKCIINGTGSSLLSVTTALSDHIPSGTKVIVDGKEVTDIGTNTTLKGKKALIGKFTNVTKADITLPKIKAGEPFPAISAVSDGVKAMGFDWHHTGETEYVNVGETPAADSTYDMYATLKPVDDFHIFVNPTVTVNGTEPCTVFTGGESIRVRYTVTVPKEKLTSIAIVITTPKEGNKPNYLCDYDETKIGVWGDVREGDDSTINKWSENGTELTSSDTFKDGHTYTARLRIYPKNGLEFADNMAVTIGGQPANFINTLSGRKHVYSVYEVSFTLGNKLKGDVNGDGQVSLLDVVFLSRAVSGVESFKQYLIPANSFDGNDEVSRLDVVLLSRRVSKGSWE